MAQVTCQWCKNKDEKTLMEQLLNKKYYHKETCLQLYSEDKKFKEKEAAQKLEMSIKIAEVYGLESYKLIPSTFYKYVEDVRNDNTLFGRYGNKNYKAGVSYSGIAYTYEYCKERIREAHRTKEFDNFEWELRYGLGIVKNNVVNARNDFLQKKKTKESLEITKSTENVYTEVENEKEVKYIKNANDDDISDMLD